MLEHLYARDFAVVAEAGIDFGPGLTVVTGETGAGKSLLVDALMLLSGSRADSSLVRAGCERAELNATFDLGHAPAAQAWLEAQEMDDDNGCQLRRVLKAGGSSRAWINGRPATLTQLNELASHLIEIHGQHEHQALLSPRHQLDLLDSRLAAPNMRQALTTTAREWRELARRIAELGGGEDRDSRIELLRHELGQLEQTALAPDELEALEATHRRLAHAERLLEVIHASLETLDGDDAGAIQTAVSHTLASLQQLTTLDDALGEPVELLTNASIAIGEACDSLRRHADDLEPEPQRLAAIDDQLSALHDLARRHGVGIAELAAKRDELAAQLDDLENAGERLAQMTREQQALRQQWQDAAENVHGQRQKAATILGREVTALMQELGMAGGRFEVALAPHGGDAPDPLGLERCEFMVSANPGQPLRALRKVASGGELARISLAIRVAASKPGNATCMVFDEVDSGVGGAVAEVVGRKLRELGTATQVLCVTHLPQVAAQGHAHVRVSKASDGKDTRTQVTTLAGDQRRDEIARMLGGIDITPETEAHARQMIAAAQQG